MNGPAGRHAGAGRFRADPHPRLAGVVVEYWGFARDLGAMGGFTITPDRFGELICCVDPLDAVEGGVRHRLPTFVLIGLLDGPLRVESDGVIRCMAARLPAWSLGEIAAADGRARPWRDAGPLFGDRAGAMAGRVRARDWPSCAGLLDEVLLDVYAGSAAEARGGDVAGPFLGDDPRPTPELASERGVTRRQVERQVRALTRCSPKRLAGLARFQRARDAIWADPSVDLAGLAFEAGYADQPHLAREFKRFSGLTPGQFVRGAIADRREIGSPDVANVQDPPRGDA